MKTLLRWKEFTPNLSKGREYVLLQQERHHPATNCLGNSSSSSANHLQKSPDNLNAPSPNSTPPPTETTRKGQWEKDKFGDAAEDTDQIYFNEAKTDMTAEPYFRIGIRSRKN